MRIRDLFVSIGFDVKDEDLKQLDRGLEKTKRLALGLGAVVTVASGLMAGLARQVAGVGDQAAKTADKLGVNVEALQEMRYAAELAGLAQNQFDTALQRMTRRAAEAARGTGEAKDALKELGVAVVDGSGRMRGSEAILADIADGMARVEDPSRRVALAFKLFDTEGVGMVNMLRNGSAELRRLRAEARGLGFVISEADARNAERFKDELTRARLVLVGIRNTLGTYLLPIFTRWIGRFRQWAVANRNAVDGFDELSRALRLAGIAAGIFLGIYSASALGNIALGITRLITAMRTLGNVALVANLKMAAIPLLIGALIALAASAYALVVEDIVRAINGDKSVTGMIVEKFRWALGLVREKLGEWRDHLIDLFDQVKAAIGEKIDWIRDKLQPIIDTIGIIRSFLKEKISIAGSAIQTGTEALGGVLASGTRALGSAIENAFGFIGMGPAVAPATGGGAVHNNSRISVSAPIRVTVPEGLSPAAAAAAARQGVSDGIQRVLQDAGEYLEPRMSR